jgi:hypothetical protein
MEIEASSLIEKRSTHGIVSILGALIGLSGINHGFFEVLQGSKPVDGLIIQAIGPANRFWIHGTEEAFTLLPDYLITGIVAMMVGIVIILWSVRYMATQHGATVFLVLCILLFLVGGGIGQIVFFVPIWLTATRIHKPLTGWQKVLPKNIRPGLAAVWPVCLAVGVGLFLFALEIAIFGAVPGVSDPEQRLYICWFALGIALVCFLISFVSGFARDLLADRPETPARMKSINAR